MRRNRMAAVLAVAMALAGCPPPPDRPEVRIGSLRDVEGNLLGELFAQTIESAGEVRVERRLGLGGTGVVLAALAAREIDLLPQYSGTLADLILRQPALTSFDSIRVLARSRGYDVSGPLGFNNTYGIGIRRVVADSVGVRRISDLVGRPWRGAVTPEFEQSVNGLASMTKAYGLTLGPVRTMEHALSYVALARGAVDFVDVYTTDATIRQQDLVVLEDDRGVFARYDGLILARPGFAAEYPRSWAALAALEGRLADSTMTRLNSAFEIERRPAADIAGEFLAGLAPPSGGAGPVVVPRQSVTAGRWGRLTIEHLLLVGVSLAIALVVGLPLGVAVSHRPRLARTVLSMVGVIQTVPGIALLCFFIPIFGIGWQPAVYALALYALLPVVQGVITGLQQIEPSLREVAAVLGMTPWERRRRVEFPLAAPAVLAGIRVAAVINVGTAALAALIGAGGFGTLIVTGLALNDWRVVMQGALPSAGLAVLLHLGFTAVEARVVKWR